MVLAKKEDNYQFKDDSTWFIRPAIAKVSFMSIDFDRDNVIMKPNPEEVIYQSTFTNTQNLPILTSYLQSHQGVSVSESFEKTSGFNLIRGMTYNINAHTPRIDVDGKLFFTMKNLREWTYGIVNNKTTSHLFESFVVAQEMDETKLEVVVKSANVQIPFEAQVRFEGVEFSQAYNGLWNADITYDYEVRVKSIEK